MGIWSNRNFSLWRPISGPVEDNPLAVCDRRTLDTSALIETDMIRGEYTGTMLYSPYEPDGRCQWYYMSGQGVEDVLLFKGFDTEDCVKCKRSIQCHGELGLPLDTIQDTNWDICRYSSYIVYTVDSLRELVS